MRLTCQMGVVVIVVGGSFMLCGPRRGAGVAWKLGSTEIGVGEGRGGEGPLFVRWCCPWKKGEGVEWLSKSDDMCFFFFCY